MPTRRRPRRAPRRRLTRDLPGRSRRRCDPYDDLRGSRLRRRLRRARLRRSALVRFRVRNIGLTLTLTLALALALALTLAALDLAPNRVTGVRVADRGASSQRSARGRATTRGGQATPTLVRVRVRVMAGLGGLGLGLGLGLPPPFAGVRGGCAFSVH